jgi:hypothetical protein
MWVQPCTPPSRSFTLRWKPAPMRKPISFLKSGVTLPQIW